MAESAAVTIRTATVDDTPTLVSLLAGGALASSPTRPEDPEGDLVAYRAAVAEIVASPRDEILVAEVDGEVVGMCQLIMFRHVQAQGDLCAEIESVHVDGRRRSGGIGTVLLDAAVNRAGAAGCYRVQLTSNVQRKDAQRFYQRHGFTPSHVGYKRLLGPTQN